MVIGNFNILLSRMDRISTKKQNLNSTIDKLDLIYNIGQLHPTTVPEHIHLKGPGNTSLGRQMLGHEVGNRFKRNIFS